MKRLQHQENWSLQVPFRVWYEDDYQAVPRHDQKIQPSHGYTNMILFGSPRSALDLSNLVLQGRSLQQDTLVLSTTVVWCLYGAQIAIINLVTYWFPYLPMFSAWQPYPAFMEHKQQSWMSAMIQITATFRFRFLFRIPETCPPEVQVLQSLALQRRN